MNVLAPVCGNTLLNKLPQSDLASILANCELTNLQHGEIIYDSGEEINSILFPLDCIVSLIYETEDGKSTEIITLGKSGAVGSEILLSNNPSSFRAIAIHSGYAYKIDKKHLLQGINESKALRELLFNHVANHLKQTALNSVCNNLHSIPQRLSKFLLTCNDLGSTDLSLTQETISYLLGTRRESITSVAFNLSEAGIIEYRRGHIKILDHEGLRSTSCDCYRHSPLKYSKGAQLAS